jgi:hypothetical protein
MNWTTFHPRGSSSTIEALSKQYSRTLKNYSKRLQDYSNYYSRLQSAQGLVRHTPQVPARKDEYRLLLEFHEILLGLMLCNPTWTPTL